MQINRLLQKLQLYKENPDIVQPITPGELADLVILVLDQVKVVEKAIEEGRLDGYTPIADKDYLSKDSAIKMLSQMVNKAISDIESTASARQSTIEIQVRQALENIQNGKDGQDGIVSEAEIQRAAEIASSLIELPDFEAMLVKAIQTDGVVIRDALESLPKGEEQLRQEAIYNLPEDLKALSDRIDFVATRPGKGGGRGNPDISQIRGLYIQDTDPGNVPDGSLWIRTA